MRISSKKGDRGITTNFQGELLEKDSRFIDLFGDLDEANSFLGLAVSSNENPEVKRYLKEIQSDLFLIGTVIGEVVRDFPPQKIKQLERNIDFLEGKLPKLKSFIIPNGSIGASFIHVSRSILRRVERKAFAYGKEKKLKKNIFKYLNRSSDLLFLLARYVNYREEIPEVNWKK